MDEDIDKSMEEGIDELSLTRMSQFCTNFYHFLT